MRGKWSKACTGTVVDPPYSTSPHSVSDMCTVCALVNVCTGHPRQNQESQDCSCLPKTVSGSTSAHSSLISSFFSLLPTTSREEEEEEKGDGGEEDVREVEKRSGGGDMGEREDVPALPLQVIERNRLSAEQIKQLPRFKNYSPGEPTPVSPSSSLYM